MLTIRNLAAVLALSLGSFGAGCAADAPPDVDTDPTTPDDQGPNPEEETPTDATGRYSMRSTFDLATNAPGQVGEVVNTIIAITDGATDPADWLLEQIGNQAGGVLEDAIDVARPFVAGYLNDRLLQFAPDFVDTTIQMGNDFGQIARNFGINETLDVTGTPGAFSSTVTAVGAHLKIDAMERDITFADHAMTNVVVQNVGVTLSSTGQFGIAQHQLPISYGKVLRVGLDTMIIPSLATGATNLQTLFTQLVDCQAFGTVAAPVINQYNPLAGIINVTPGMVATGCTAGLNAAATMIYNKINGLDGSALELGLTGTARAIDTNSDRRIDRIQTGTWAGEMSYAGTPAPLSTATFFGERM